ncbi:hypothetical protein BX600DRAFT_517801 [Xylariales sp. PMI_506]|nr:hypothetical protein BX600DRAFT_517801 [Xylariales sp. PMI_506]
MSSTRPQLRQRLLQDIDELCRKPYPNIELHVHDEDLTSLCLVLSPRGYKKMHLTILHLDEYPIRPPYIRMDSRVYHPNIFGSYICASILNTEEGYTPAYTLKGIAIQLLSFFGSDTLEQDHGWGVVETVDLSMYRRGNSSGVDEPADLFSCTKCGFENRPQKKQIPGAVYVKPYRRRRTQNQRDSNASSSTSTVTSNAGFSADNVMKISSGLSCQIDMLPNEMLVSILEEIEETEDLISLARAWPRVSGLIADFDVMRQRELQCFVLKKTYREVRLGVGISHSHTAGLGSEFDLLSDEAFSQLSVRRSIHGVPFQRWLPLPLSLRHWDLVRDDAERALDSLRPSLKVSDPARADVLYSFMTDVVVKLNMVEIDHRRRRKGSYGDDGDAASRSTLRHASEKAIESYFHLFHLLVCLATESPDVVRHANRLIANFAAGRRSKRHCPNLGHLLVALLISDVPVSEDLIKAIVTEAITRNVVWLLTSHPELAYAEADAASAYRLDTTFAGSRTSYRLLMFSELFRRTARPNRATPLAAVRDALFARHGAPPPGAAARLAAEVRRLHDVTDFPQFLREMLGAEFAVPTAAAFTGVLRGTLRSSAEQGYSVGQHQLRQQQQHGGGGGGGGAGINQVEALALRLACEPGVSVQPQHQVLVNQWRADRRLPRVRMQGRSFFPRGGNRKSGGDVDRYGRRRRS